MTTLIPKNAQPPLDPSGLFTLPWRRWLEAVNTALNSAGDSGLSLSADIAAIATALGSPDGTVANIPDQSSLGDVIYGRNGVTVTGKLGQVPVYVELQPLEDSGVGTALYKFTRDDYGRVEGTQAATTSDLTEGANLYYTDARADARVQAFKDAPALTLANLANAVDDTAAATAGVAVGALYRNGSVLMIRAA